MVFKSMEGFTGTVPAAAEVDIEIYVVDSQFNRLDEAPHLLIPRQFSEYIIGSSNSLVSQNEIMHVIFMSARSLDRYNEAEVFLKSLLFHIHSSSRLVLHLLIDEGAYLYFHQLFEVSNFPQRFPNVAIVIHDYHRVCSEGTDDFLARFKIPQSPHHSGKAGYCRLFIPAYFESLSKTLSSHTAKYSSVIIPDKVIVLETDQLVLTNIEDLWEL
jgi:hypothetical protein